MATADDLVMAILSDLSDRRERLLPPPLHYRLAPATVAALVPQLATAPGSSGHLWGIPFVVSAEVPPDRVLLTTDYETWQEVPCGDE